jgi:hypothetical protein
MLICCFARDLAVSGTLVSRCRYVSVSGSPGHGVCRYLMTFLSRSKHSDIHYFPHVLARDPRTQCVAATATQRHSKYILLDRRMIISTETHHCHLEIRGESESIAINSVQHNTLQIWRVPNRTSISQPLDLCERSEELDQAPHGGILLARCIVNRI